jgi:hypothetical protein
MIEGIIDEIRLSAAKGPLPTLALRKKVIVHPSGQRKSLNPACGGTPFPPTKMACLVKALEAAVKGFSLPAELLRKKKLTNGTLP